MKIFAISVIKNEADVIRQNLAAASSWADKIFVYDNGSTDGTWEIVQAMANDIIVPWKQEAKPFYEGLRGEVFQNFRHLAQEGDWWCFRLDADEFYIDDPREFLPKVSRLHHLIVTDTFQFRLTYEDLAEYGLQRIADSDISKLQYYEKKTWSEARFFRHRSRLKWPLGDDRPQHSSVLSPRQIRIRHYQYRTLEQIQRRIEVRRQAREAGFAGWDHAAVTQLEEYLVHRKDLFRYQGDGVWQTDGTYKFHNLNTPTRWLKIALHALRILP